MPRAPAMVPNTREEEACLRLGYRRVAGLDEVGRGPLAGPVVAAAVVLPSCRGAWWEAVRDSKALTPLARARLAPRIEAEAAVGVGLASSQEVDAWGLTRATRLAMERALRSLLVPPDFLLVDGLPTAWLGAPQRAIVGGDATCLSVAAASVVAKLFRDRLMEEQDRCYPAYGFARHRGYATADHLAALRARGPCPIHRVSYRPVAEAAGRPASDVKRASVSPRRRL